MKANTSVYIETKLKKRAQHRAIKDGTSLSELINNAIKEHLS